MCVGAGGQGAGFRARGSWALSARRVSCQEVTRIFTALIARKELGRQDDSVPFPPPLSPHLPEHQPFKNISIKEAKWNPGEAGGLLGGLGGTQRSSMACKSPSEHESQNTPVFPALGSAGRDFLLQNLVWGGCTGAQVCGVLPDPDPAPDRHTPPQPQSPCQARPDLHPPPNLSSFHPR